MASSLLSLSTILFIIFSLQPSFSTSRRVLDVHATRQHETGFRVVLKHVDSGKNLTKFERLQRGVKRGNHRLQRLMENMMASLSVETSTTQVTSPVHAGNGEFLMNLAIGTPPEPYAAIMDTGSDLICLCKALPTSDCGSDGCCGEDNEGSGFNQGGGLVGLGRGPLSLVSQLKQSKFSYCLTSISDETSSQNPTSTLVMGSLATETANSSVYTTPLIKNPSHPSFYYLSLVGISVGNVDLPIKKSTFAVGSDGTGGMIIDSGTTITYLQESAFELVKKEFVSQMILNVDNSDSTGLDLCFELPEDDGSGETTIEIPKLVFHFDGASLDLPGENYMIGDVKSGLVCLAMGSSSGISIFGNIQQQNMMVVHDLEKETLSFVPTKCDQL
ncbi:putative nepenthesin [Helianthus debilis subsp. tardiflorus]